MFFRNEFFRSGFHMDDPHTWFQLLNFCLLHMIPAGEHVYLITLFRKMSRDLGHINILTAAIDPSLLTPFGSAHGGVTAAIVDHVTGVVVYPLMERGQWAATTEIKVNYLAPLRAETVDAEASVVAMTKRSAVVRCELYRQDERRRILAAAQATLTIVDAR